MTELIWTELDKLAEKMAVEMRAKGAKLPAMLRKYDVEFVAASKGYSYLRIAEIFASHGITDKYGRQMSEQNVRRRIISSK